MHTMVTSQAGQPTPKRTRIRLLPRDDTLGWTRYAWLLYLPTFLIDPILRTRAGSVPIWLWPLTIAGLIAFLISYFLAYWQPRRLTLIGFFQAGLGVLFAPINTGASVFFVYGASFVAQIEDGKRGLRLVLLITLIGVLTSLLTTAPLYFLINAAVITPFIGGLNLHSTRVNRTQRKLKLAQDEIEHLAAVAERERIARDLHDVLGHTLSLIILKSELAARLADRDPARAAREIRDVEAVARTALHDVREAIRGYRPSLSDEVERAHALLRAADVQASFVLEPPALSPVHTETLAFALREAITNVVRHAQARTCKVAVRQERDAVRLEVMDDGRGLHAPEGAGLRGMRARIEALGGSLEYLNQRGTRLVVTLPLPSTGMNQRTEAVTSIA